MIPHPTRLYNFRCCDRAGNCTTTVEIRPLGVGDGASHEFSISLFPAMPKPSKMRKRDRDRAEALRLASRPKPSLKGRAVALAREQRIVRTRELTDIGVPRCWPACAMRACLSRSAMAGIAPLNRRRLDPTLGGHAR